MPENFEGLGASVSLNHSEKTEKEEGYKGTKMYEFFNKENPALIPIFLDMHNRSLIDGSLDYIFEDRDTVSEEQWKKILTILAEYKTEDAKPENRGKDLKTGFGRQINKIIDKWD